jgi:hypothetical protein
VQLADEPSLTTSEQLGPAEPERVPQQSSRALQAVLPSDSVLAAGNEGKGAQDGRGGKREKRNGSTHGRPR